MARRESGAWGLRQNCGERGLSRNVEKERCSEGGEGAGERGTE